MPATRLYEGGLVVNGVRGQEAAAAALKKVAVFDGGMAQRLGMKVCSARAR
jgi:hypothetical protein